MDRLFRNDRPTKVLLGVDGSDEALRAAGWAAALAGRRIDSIHLIHAWIWPLMKVDLEPVPGVANSGLRHAAEAVLEQAREAVVAAGSPARISAQLIVGDAAPVLVAAAAEADITIVGNRGLGGLYGRLLGSTGMRLISQASGPVLIVRGEDRPTAPLLSAVDGSPESRAALRVAASLAERLQTPLRLVHVIRSGSEGTEAMTAAADLMESALEAARETAPAVELSSAVVTARSAAKGLLKETSEARMLILGPHGRGKGFENAVGSTANAALQHSGAPILVVR